MVDNKSDQQDLITNALIKAPKALYDLGAKFSDIVIPASESLTGRLFVSPWQRVAAGAVIAVVGYDKNGEMHAALGTQRGKISLAQGYMESNLPSKKDYTGLSKRGASRYHAKNKDEVVLADKDLKENAVREAKEELNLTIRRDQLIHIGVDSANENPIIQTVAESFLAIADKTIDNYPLTTVDDEFASDDLDKPRWAKIQNIQKRGDEYYVENSPLPIAETSVRILSDAVRKAGEKKLEQISGGVLLTHDAVLARYNQSLNGIAANDHPEVAELRASEPKLALGQDWINYQGKVEAIASKMKGLNVTRGGGDSGNMVDNQKPAKMSFADKITSSFKVSVFTR